ncbi:CPBP family intramembrane glutamic endopeptidase [Sinomicrobium sp. M5D2P17]
MKIHNWFYKAILLSLVLILLNFLANKIFVSYGVPVYLQVIVTIFSYTFLIYLGSYWSSNRLSRQFFIVKWLPNSKLIFYGIIGIAGLFLINNSVVISFWRLFPGREEYTSPDTDLDVISIISILIILPYLEELFFRKLLAKSLFEAYGFSKALMVSAVLFGLSHTGTDSGLLPAFLGGLFLGYIYLKSRYLYLVIILHALYNLFNLTIFQDLFKLQSNDPFFMNTMNFNMLLFIFILGVFMVFISISKFKKCDCSLPLIR